MNNIKYLDQTRYYEQGKASNWEANHDYGDEYVRVYFNIDAKHYFHPFESYPGYEEDKAAFKQEVYNIFHQLGWEIEHSKHSSACDRAKKGLNNLYLHPQQFSGIVLKNEVKEVATILNQAITFKLTWVRVLY